jgi:hypothetical protein
MKTDVLELVENAGDLTHVVVLTYNLDFRFVQHLLRPALRRCGHPSLTIFADARRAAESFARGGAQPGGLGVRYRVVGVPMPAGAAFHPKAVLLSGRERGTLLIGSGNLGFGGWRENGEIWLRRASDRHGTRTFAAFREYLRRILDRVPLPEAIADDIEAAFDGATRPWAQAMEPPGGLLGRVGSGPSLLERMRAELTGRRHLRAHDRGAVLRRPGRGGHRARAQPSGRCRPGCSCPTGATTSAKPPRPRCRPTSHSPAPPSPAAPTRTRDARCSCTPSSTRWRPAPACTCSSAARTPRGPR